MSKRKHKKEDTDLEWKFWAAIKSTIKKEYPNDWKKYYP